MADNGYESLGIDERGMLKLFEDGLSHTDFTLLMEGLDNMVKALIKINSKEPFHIHENEYQKVFYDYGCGMNKLRENLKGGLRSEDNHNSLSKCGIGLNTMIAKYLKDYGYFFIITAFQGDGDVNYDGVFMIREDDLIKRINIKVESKKFRPYVEDGLFKDGKTGTFMFTDMRMKDDYKDKENDIALNDLKNFLKNNCLEVTHQFRKDSKLVPGGPDKLKYEDAGIHYKLSRILEGCEINCYYNNDKVEVDNYITDKDTIIFDHTLYIKRNSDNNYPIIAFLNTNVLIRAGKTTNQCSFHEFPNTTMDETYMDNNDFKKLGRYSVYLHEGKITIGGKGNKKDLLKNQYIINGIRTVGFGKMCTNNFTNCPTPKGKMEIDLSYMKQFLNGKKTDEHFYDMQMDEDLKRINNILTKSLVFEPLLNRNGYTFSSNHLTGAGTKAHYNAFITKEAHNKFKLPVVLDVDTDVDTDSSDGEVISPMDGKVLSNKELTSQHAIAASLDGDEEVIAPKQPETFQDVFKKPQSTPKPSPKPAQPTPSPPQKDPRREFSQDEKREIMKIQNNKCLGCNVALDNYHIHYEFDHIIQHCEGGPTNIVNGRALCRNCHKSNNLQWFKEGLVDDQKKKEHVEKMIELYKESLRELNERIGRA